MRLSHLVSGLLGKRTNVWIDKVQQQQQQNQVERWKVKHTHTQTGQDFSFFPSLREQKRGRKSAELYADKAHTHTHTHGGTRAPQTDAT